MVVAVAALSPHVFFWRGQAIEQRERLVGFDRSELPLWYRFKHLSLPLLFATAEPPSINFDSETQVQELPLIFRNFFLFFTFFFFPSFEFTPSSSSSSAFQTPSLGMLISFQMPFKSSQWQPCSSLKFCCLG
jgi:hypothetical protein